MVRQLDHLNLDVRSLEASTDFYRNLFGFEVVESGHSMDSDFRIIRAGDAMLCLYERGVTPGGGLNHFALRVEQAEALVARAREHGVELLWGGEEGVSWDHSQAWYVRDPDGYVVEIAQWNGDVVRF